MTATSILVHRTLAAAQQEGMPEPYKVTLDADSGTICMHLRSTEEAVRWREWWDLHGAAVDWRRARRLARGSRHRNVVLGDWCGWRIELVYLTPVEGGPGDIYDPQEVGQ